MPASLLAFIADTVLVLHALLVVFVVGLLPLVFIGARRWRWVRKPWLRGLHLLAIGIVVLQAWIGATCPLTDWEWQLRVAAGQPADAGSFIGRWLQAGLYWSAPDWVFTAVYTAFGVLVAASWIAVPPRRAAATKVSDGCRSD